MKYPEPKSNSETVTMLVGFAIIVVSFWLFGLLASLLFWLITR